MKDQLHEVVDKALLMWGTTRPDFTVAATRKLLSTEIVRAILRALEEEKRC